ncbi:MAG: hypothetical protein P4L20_07290 [Acidimicrobiales bacterium]|nr:hypothetical protein [Acidimicrobiales bacterium]
MLQTPGEQAGAEGTRRSPHPVRAGARTGAAHRRNITRRTAGGVARAARGRIQALLGARRYLTM